MASAEEIGRRKDPDSTIDEKSNRQNGNGTSEELEQDGIEYNPRWMGYICIVMFSGINFISISTIPWESRSNVWASSIPFGILTFLMALIILIQDRCRKTSCGFDYTKSKNGYVEGSTLLFSVIWWIVGVAYITRPWGIAYRISNIYFSSWLTLFACIYTLNEWSDSKDILSIAEITSVSFTLPYWWIHFIAAFVVFVNCCIMEIQLGDTLTDSFKVANQTLFGIFVGLLSLTVSFSFILVHYDFFTFVEEGGWTELLSSLFLVLIWIISISIFTKNDGIAATISGSDCITRLVKDVSNTKSIHNCTIVKNGIATPCRFGWYMPGSNLYFACWACMLSSIAIALKWKAAKALKFAESEASREQQQQALGEGYGDDDAVDVDDDVTH